MTIHPLTQSSLEPIDRLTSLAKAAGDSLRLSVLKALEKNAYAVQELADAFCVKQSGMSHHLKILSNSGLVSTRREGNTIFYRRSNLDSKMPLNDLKQSLFDHIDQITLNEEYQHGLKIVHNSRSTQSQQFFISNAEEFKAQQDLIADFSVYGKPIEELLNALDEPKHLALEIGPGQGELLTFLSKKFDQVIALDNNEKMLELASNTCQEAGLDNITLTLGDTHFAKTSLGKCDLAIANMVLHHTPEPADIFHDIASLLNKNASFIVTELCHHQQDWARKACGDIWLGFEPEQLDTWAKSAGLNVGQGSFLALRNGFQIQIRQFIKH